VFPYCAEVARMPVEHKRTAKAYRESHGKAYREHLEDGSQQYNILVQNNKDISDYCCALELSGCSFYYIPDTKEVLYIISRMRNPRYNGGHEPERDSVCDVWKAENGHVFVRIGLARINVYGSDHAKLTESERDWWREYIIEWIEEKLIQAESEFPKE
jgi:hypothetical protein